MSVQSGFTGGDYELVVGKVRGLRRWTVEDNGVLVGAIGTFWKPKTNFATCWHAESDKYTKALRLLNTNADNWLDYKKKFYSDPHLGMREHDMRHCTCGFYAYHSDKAAYGSAFMPVLGVVEGWGRVTYGDKGFRSEYAEIVAIVDTEQTTGSMEWFYQAACAYFVVMILLGLWSLLNPLFTGDEWSAWPLLTIATSGAWLWWIRRTENKRRANLSTGLTSKIQEQYPNVKVYSSQRKMLKDFPIEKVA